MLDAIKFLLQSRVNDGGDHHWVKQAKEHLHRLESKHEVSTEEVAKAAAAPLKLERPEAPGHFGAGTPVPATGGPVTMKQASQA